MNVTTMTPEKWQAAGVFFNALQACGWQPQFPARVVIASMPGWLAALQAEHDGLSELLDDPEADDRETREAAAELLITLNAAYGHIENLITAFDKMRLVADTMAGHVRTLVALYDRTDPETDGISGADLVDVMGEEIENGGVRDAIQDYDGGAS